MSSDYNTISQPLFFPEGSTPGGNDQACFFIAPIDDSELEFSENFMLVASSDNVDLEFTQDGGNMAVVNIIDDDSESFFVPDSAEKHHADFAESILILQKHIKYSLAPD